MRRYLENHRGTLMYFDAELFVNEGTFVVIGISVIHEEMRKCDVCASSASQRVTIKWSGQWDFLDFLYDQ